MRKNNKNGCNIKIVIIQGIFSIIVAIIAGIFSYKAGEKAAITEVNNEISQEVNIDNGDYVTIIKELVNENEKLQQEIKKLEEVENMATDSIAKDVTNSNVIVERAESKNLAELKIVDSRFYNTINNFSDSYGNNYNKSYELAGSSVNADAYVVYSLQGNYKEFSASIVTGDKTNSDMDATLYIYKDDILIDTISGIQKQTERIDIGPYDINDARKLTIQEVVNKGIYAYVYLVDAYVN